MEIVSKSDEIADMIYDLLVAECDATDSESERYQFWNFFARRFTFREFRFCGSLGFGGKFYENGGRWYVDCYPEDRTPERAATILRANKRLAVLHETYASTLQFLEGCHDSL